MATGTGSLCTIERAGKPYYSVASSAHLFYRKGHFEASYAIFSCGCHGGIDSVCFRGRISAQGICIPSEFKEEELPEWDLALC